MGEAARKLLRAMTLEEKISLFAGANRWETEPIERLGIPSIKMTDGPNGARGALGTSGPPSVCFPVGVGLAATWNTDLVESVGSALGEGTKAKNAQILLAPTVNIQRSPLAGRNFECYSEDPILTGDLAVARQVPIPRRPPVITVPDALPLPTEGRPESFTGAVGKYDISALAVPTNVRVGDPIELVIDIRGDLIETLPAPDLTAIPRLTEDFRVPAETLAGTVSGDRKRFTQRIRAKRVFHKK